MYGTMNLKFIIHILCYSPNVNYTAESKRVTWINYRAGEVCAYFACRAAPCHVAPAALTQFTAARGSRRPSATDRANRSIANVVDSCGDGEGVASRLWDASEESLAWAIPVCHWVNSCRHDRRDVHHLAAQKFSRQNECLQISKNFDLNDLKKKVFGLTPR